MITGPVSESQVATFVICSFSLSVLFEMRKRYQTRARNRQKTPRFRRVLPSLILECQKVRNASFGGLDAGEIRLRVTLYLSTAGAGLFSAMPPPMSRS
jgi:hypothetical protein